MFKITRGKGFHITLANGYTVSVQFGSGNYCDNYSTELPLTPRSAEECAEEDRRCGEVGSRTAETAVLSPDRKLIECPLWPGDTVQPNMDPSDVVYLLNWVESLPDEE